MLALPQNARAIVAASIQVILCWLGNAAAGLTGVVVMLLVGFVARVLHSSAVNADRRDLVMHGAIAASVAVVIGIILAESLGGSVSGWLFGLAAALGIVVLIGTRPDYGDREQRCD